MRQTCRKLKVPAHHMLRFRPPTAHTIIALLESRSLQRQGSLPPHLSASAAGPRLPWLNCRRTSFSTGATSLAILPLVEGVALRSTPSLARSLIRTFLIGRKSAPILRLSSYGTRQGR